MHPEYLYNNDTQDIAHRVKELATLNESALREHCQEVSRQTDTSSLCLQKDCIMQVNAASGILSIIEKHLRQLSQSLYQNAGVFRTQNAQAQFSSVCKTVTALEAERLRLLSCIGELTGGRRSVAQAVAKANQALHLLSLSKCAVGEDIRPLYTAETERINTAYGRLISLDHTLCEVQAFYMTLLEKQLPAFMKGLREAADFNHAGEALDSTAIRALCGEFFILCGRAPNVSF
jgi:hypothetical protein